MLPNINNQDFLLAIRNGDERAFTQLFNEMKVSLASYAFRILFDQKEAEEVVHTTFCKLWDNRGKIEINESIKSYLYKSVYNNSISILRKKKQFGKYFELGLTDVYFNKIVQDPNSEMRIVDSETRKIILEAINDLPEKCRNIFVSCKIDGLTYRQVAEKYNLSEKTVENQMSIALKRLRKDLDWLLVLLLINNTL